jgi:antitoxin VapB
MARFDDNQHQQKLGNSRLVTPVDQRWDAFFVNGPASENFMSEREQPSPEEREPL